MREKMEFINGALEQHEVCAIYSLFSGGHDSLTATHLASQHPAFTGVIHIDTGTGLPETLNFVKETCAVHDWPLVIQQPCMPYESILMKWGFPGPAMHPTVYQRLKERALRQAIKDIKKAAGHSGKNKVKVGLASGVRIQESDRRAEIRTDTHTDGSALYIPLIHDFAAVDVTEYISRQRLRRSPVKDKIHMSGECFCGCYSRPAELAELKIWYPAQHERILRWRNLVRLARENQVWEYGQGFRGEVTIKENACEWGGPKGAHPPEQGDFLMMCQHCR